MIVTRKNAAPTLPSPCTACKGGQIWLHSLTSGGVGSQFLQIFLRVTEAEMVKLWKSGMIRLSDQETVANA
jgi:hypothetical protein